MSGLLIFFILCSGVYLYINCLFKVLRLVSKDDYVKIMLRVKFNNDLKKLGIIMNIFLVDYCNNFIVINI